MFDDDEEEQFAEEADEEEPKGIRAENEGEAEGEDSALTDAGKELRKILKNHRDEDLSEGSEEMSGSDDDDDDDFDEEKLPNLIFPTLPSGSPAQTAADDTNEDNVKKEPVADSTRSSTPPIPGSPDKEKKKSSSKKESRSSKKSKQEKEKGEEKKPKSESKTKKTGGSPPTVSTDSPVALSPTASSKSGVKRPASPDTGASNAAPKKPKTEMKVSEAEVIKLLKKHPKGLPTLDFIKHFKSAIAADPEQKKKLTAITTKVCAIATKGILVLRSEYNK